MMSDALAWARAYADHGLAILPVRPDKTPLTPHGLKDASGDPVVIESLGTPLALRRLGLGSARDRGRNRHRREARPKRLPGFQAPSRMRPARHHDAVGVNAQRRDAPLL